MLPRLRLALALLAAAWAACGLAAAQVHAAGQPRMLIPRLGPYKRAKADLAAAAKRAGGADLNHDLALPSTISSSLLSRCTLTWRTGTLDHFGWGIRAGSGGKKNAWKQRVFICADAWKAAGAPPAPTIFLYTGNEADVLLYLNNTGAMWDNAEEFQAVLVFAEHRFYGESVPFGGPTDRRGCESVAAALESGEVGCPATAALAAARASSWHRPTAISTTFAAHPHRLRYLSAEQALADYAELVGELRAALPGGGASPCIAFGGSYGGMLATWLRMKYPHAVVGAVAGSAPIWAFERPTADPPVDGQAFGRIVAADAGPPGGSDAACAGTVRAAWKALFAAVGMEEGEVEAPRPSPPPAARAAAAALRLCPGVRLATRSDAGAVADWAAGAFDYLAMGDYPYPSAYITNGDGVLPAFPMREACRRAVGSAGGQHASSSTAALTALADAVGVFYNFSGSIPCYDPAAGGDSASTDADGWLWGYQACTEQVMPMWRDGVGDLGPAAPWDGGAFADACAATYGGVRPRPLWANTEWGGRHLASLTNVVWTNGDLDPWSGTGVTAASAAGADLSPSAAIIPVAGGAHHLDLMFSHPDDPPGVVEARGATRAHMRAWVAEALEGGAGGWRAVEMQK